MNLTIQSIKEAAHFAPQACLASAHEWLGRVVRWMEGHYSLVQIPNQLGGAAAIFAADLAIFQLVYRIAHFVNPEGDNIEVQGAANFKATFTYTLLGFMLGAAAITRVIQTSLSISAHILLGITAIVTSIFPGYKIGLYD